MEIALIDFDTGNDICAFGMHKGKAGSKTCINLFGLQQIGEEADLKLPFCWEDKPDPVDHIWGIRKHILEEVHMNSLKKDEVIWTLTNGFRTTTIEFHEINGQPSKLSFSDKHTINSPRFSYEKYCEEYHERGGKPVHKSDLQSSLELTLDDYPFSIFAVPCAQAKGGVFYCQPEYYDGLEEERFDFMIADTTKLVQRIGKDDPHVIEHAHYKFNEGTEGWIKHNSLRNPCKTGSYVISNLIRENNDLSPRPGLTMSSGYAGVLILAQELKLPFLPIAIAKSGAKGTPDDVIGKNIVSKKIAYTGSGSLKGPAPSM